MQNFFRENKYGDVILTGMKDATEMCLYNDVKCYQSFSHNIEGLMDLSDSINSES